MDGKDILQRKKMKNFQKKFGEERAGWCVAKKGTGGVDLPYIGIFYL